MLDIGGRKEGYCSDMTRTYFCKQVSEKHAAIHDIVRQANEAAEALVRPGVPLCELDKAARDVIAQAGYGEYFTHRLGHFIGRTDHRAGGRGKQRPPTALAQEGMVFSHRAGHLPARGEGRAGGEPRDLVCEVLNQVDKHWQVIG